MIILHRSCFFGLWAMEQLFLNKCGSWIYRVESWDGSIANDKISSVYKREAVIHCLLKE